MGIESKIVEDTGVHKGYGFGDASGKKCGPIIPWNTVFQKKTCSSKR